MRKFDKNEDFCPQCLTHHYFYVGGGSHSPSLCPNHKTNESILWKQMNIFQKRKAAKLFDQMWNEKHNRSCDEKADRKGAQIL